MSLHDKKQFIHSQIIETRRLLELVDGHPLMAEGLNERIEMLEEELKSIPEEVFKPTAQFLFSGYAVSGSEGIKATFASKVMPPIQGLVRTQLAVNKYGKVGRRGRAKRGEKAELFLTALPKGSFGVELSKIDNDIEDLYDIVDTSEAMKDVILLIKNISGSEEVFESTIESTPKRNLINLKKLLQEVANEKSILKMDCGDIHVELSNEDVEKASNRVSYAFKEDREIVVIGIFRGMLLDSNRFEIQDENGKPISGIISEDLDEEQLVEYDKKFLNVECAIHLRVYNTTFKAGKDKLDYELLEIKSLL